MIRNPYRALLSAYKHRKYGVHSGTESELRINILGALEQQEKRISFAELESFSLEQIENWRDIIVDWVSLGKVLVVFYENLVKEKMSELKRIFAFLEIPIIEWRFHCISHAPLDFYKRQNQVQLKKQLFSEKLNRKISATVNELNNILTSYGHESLPTSYNDF